MQALFNPNWVTSSVRHHLVPNTYLKGWAVNGSTVYFIEKDEKDIDFTSKDYGRNTERLGRINHFYSRRAGALFRDKNDCDMYFEPIKKHSYRVKIDGIEINDTIELNDKFYLFDNWEIINGTNNLITKELKDSLKKEILAIHNSSLEEGWSRLVENDWPSVRNDLLSAVSKETGDIMTAVRKKDLVKFMVSMDWRTIPAPEPLLSLYNSFVQVLGIKDLLDSTIDEEDKMYPFIDTFNEEMLHNFLLKQFDKFFNEKGPIFLAAEKIYNEMVIELLVPPSGSEFITSDNPIFMYKDKDGKAEYMLPISPNLACAVRNAGEVEDIKNYYLTKLDKDQVYEYNETIKNNCNKWYILSQKSLKPYFK
ncbi:DUF4238 domain-containing protein [Lysinibacillus xylanilyticus]|uniref:DUF4238 domain-containing protein n=1 Tax=Lysinibacillus xylanilyticus TaxID=582475 RepID=UPI00380176AA